MLHTERDIHVKHMNNIHIIYHLDNIIIVLLL